MEERKRFPITEFDWNCAKDLTKIAADLDYAEAEFEKTIFSGTYADQEQWRAVVTELKEIQKRGLDWLMGRDYRSGNTRN